MLIKIDGGNWKQAGSQQMFTLASCALFELRGWPRHSKCFYRVTCGESSMEGVFRPEPKPGEKVRMMGLSCLKDVGWPWKEAIAEMVEKDPDIVYFSGDQIYENDYNSPVFVAERSDQVAEGMKNYLPTHAQSRHLSLRPG